ncbi:hypothetical protein AK812_SmicGene40700 [Symbiodinium microadriaticum]|uniref:Uncharacterized protein n=1 Tax=Symbiodinium microadriaticum TaxID=2951 RepID=A0A1Q9C802_SYMMI|nr:hypothetical protein AK812_SmicGene40700 [Symbiodinium microadriaticum]CAE7343519.1 unnamed protein product [Symbiodinium microadriaticum]CAE7364956.1 unnamed protein product [Symbiodinium sp. KB8]
MELRGSLLTKLGDGIDLRKCYFISTQSAVDSACKAMAPYILCDSPGESMEQVASRLQEAKMEHCKILSDDDLVPAVSTLRLCNISPRQGVRQLKGMTRRNIWPTDSFLDSRPVLSTTSQANEDDIGDEETWQSFGSSFGAMSGQQRNAMPDRHAAPPRCCWKMAWGFASCCGFRPRRAAGFPRATQIWQSYMSRTPLAWLNQRLRTGSFMFPQDGLVEKVLRDRVEEMV